LFVCHTKKDRNQGYGPLLINEIEKATQLGRWNTSRALNYFKMR